MGIALDLSESSALAALVEIPGRLAALEQEQAKTRSELQALRAAQPPLLCSVAEAATRLKVGIPTIRRRIKAGDLPTVRIGNSIRVDLTGIHGVDAAGVAKLAQCARLADADRLPRRCHDHGAREAQRHDLSLRRPNDADPPLVARTPMA